LQSKQPGGVSSSVSSMSDSATAPWQEDVCCFSSNQRRSFGERKASSILHPDEKTGLRRLYLDATRMPPSRRERQRIRPPWNDNATIIQDNLSTPQVTPPDTHKSNTQPKT
jgi:hypothetical protein